MVRIYSILSLIIFSTISPIANVRRHFRLSELIPAVPGTDGVYVITNRQSAAVMGKCHVIIRFTGERKVGLSRYCDLCYDRTV